MNKGYTSTTSNPIPAMVGSGMVSPLSSSGGSAGATSVVSAMYNAFAFGNYSGQVGEPLNGANGNGGYATNNPSLLQHHQH